MRPEEHDSVKIKHVILLCALSCLTGVVLCLWYVRRHIVRYGPVDRALYGNLVDFAHAPVVAIDGDRTNRTYWLYHSGPSDPSPVTRAQVLQFLERLAERNTNELICFSIPASASVAEIDDLVSLAKQHGVRNLRVLVRSGTRQRDHELFREVRIGETSALSW